MNSATTSQQALQNLQQYQGSAQTSQQALDSANQQYGTAAAQQQVQGLRGAIQNTTNLLNNVAPSVQGRTGNSLVTSAQANQIINNEQAPISATLSKENTDYGNDESDAQNLQQEAQSAAQAKLQDQTNQESYLQNIYNDLYTGESDSAKLAEQQREADLSAKASSSSDGLASTLGSLFGGGSAAAPASPTGSLTGGKTSAQAQSYVSSLLKTNNANTIINTYNALVKSAGYGNTYDAAKLQLMQAAAPGFFKNGTLNNSYVAKALSLGKMFQ